MLAGLGGLGAIATNLLLPALPSIRAQFAVSVAAAQTTVSAYLVAFALSMLVAGPLSDRFGRRPLILGGLAIFAAGSLLATAAPTLPLLVLARVIQAVGAAASLIVARAIAGDLYQGAALARMIAVITMAMVMGTTLSPLAGGWLVTRFDWHAGFWLLLAASAVLALVCARLLPETGTHGSRPGSWPELLRQARAILARPAFLACMLQASVIYSVFIVFIAVAPYIMVSAYRRPVTEFGVYYMALSIGYFLGNLYVSNAAHRVDTLRLMRFGLALQLASACVALAFVLAGFANPLWAFGPMLPLALGQGLSLPNLNARAVSLAPGFAGVASSLIGFSQQAIGGIGVQAMGFAPTDSAVPVLLFCAGMSALGLLPVAFTRVSFTRE